MDCRRRAFFGSLTAPFFARTLARLLPHRTREQEPLNAGDVSRLRESHAGIPASFVPAYFEMSFTTNRVVFDRLKNGDPVLTPSGSGGIISLDPEQCRVTVRGHWEDRPMAPIEYSAWIES